MLNLTDSDVKSLGEDRFIKKNKILMLVAIVGILIGAVILINIGNINKATEYKRVNSDETVTIQYEDGTLILNDVIYNKTTNNVGDGLGSIVLLGLLSALTGVFIIVWVMLTSDKHGKQLLEEYKKDNKPCETP